MGVRRGGIKTKKNKWKENGEAYNSQHYFLALPKKKKKKKVAGKLRSPSNIYFIIQQFIWPALQMLTCLLTIVAKEKRKKKKVGEQGEKQNRQ